jgi:hypothetical protein
VEKLGFELLAKKRGGIGLASSVRTDLADFLRLYASGGAKDWREAVELYRGIPLIECPYEWAAEYEGFYDTRYYELLSRLAAHFDAEGNTILARYYKDKLTE